MTTPRNKAGAIGSHTSTPGVAVLRRWRSAAVPDASSELFSNP